MGPQPYRYAVKATTITETPAENPTQTGLVRVNACTEMEQ
jgi:hypothetical protein